MKKESIVYGIIGLIVGSIIGFMFANSVNKNGPQVVSANTTMGQPAPANVDPAEAHQANMPEVQAALEKAKSEPNNFDAQVNAASFYMQIQRFDQAIELLQRANKIQPENYDVIVGLGNAYFDTNKFQDAEKWYQVALEKKQDDVNVRTDYGLTFLLREKPDYDRSIAEFNKSLEIDPQHKQTLQNLTVAYTRKGDSANATETYRKLEALDAQNPMLAQLKSEIDKL
ncbi:MAG: tetratricopeptide repeat protein [Pyrinomonadaceae bacterium]